MSLVQQCIHPPPHPVPCDVTSKVDNHAQQVPWLPGRTAASLKMHNRKSVALVLILSRKASKQLALSVVAGDYPT